MKTGSQFVWRSDPLVTRCGRGSPHSAEWAPGPPVQQHQENGKETLMAIRVGVNMLQFCSVSNSLSHATFQKKWEVYFSKNCVARLHCVNMYFACICVYMHIYYVAIQQNSIELKGSPRGEVAYMMNWDIRESKFELQLHYYVHFRTNTLGISMNYIITSAMS